MGQAKYFIGVTACCGRKIIYLEANEILDAEVRHLKEERQMLEDILKGIQVPMTLCDVTVANMLTLIFT